MDLFGIKAAEQIEELQKNLKDVTHRLDSINCRIDSLLQRLQYQELQTTISVPDEGNLPIDKAIKLLLDHLNLQLVFRPEEFSVLPQDSKKEKE